MYCRMRGPAVDADPARARPKPSKIVFLPRAITFSGMSSYFVFTINSETYFVSPGALANSSTGADPAKASVGPLRRASPASASEDLQKSRRIIECHLWDRLTPAGLIFSLHYQCNRLKPVLLKSIPNLRGRSKRPVRWRFCQQCAQIESACVHRQISLWIAWPMILRLVAIQFDSVVVRVAQIDGLAYPMVRCAFQRNPRQQHSAQSARQSRARGVDNGRMVQPGRSPRWRRTAQTFPCIQRDW